MRFAVNESVGPLSARDRSAANVGPWLWRMLLFVALGCCVATQFVAWRYHDDPQLGQNWGGIYPPWMAFVWAWWWAQADPVTFQGAGALGLAASLFSTGLLLWNRWQAKPSGAVQYLHGSARWAQKSDLHRAGLLSERGPYVGGWRNGWLGGGRYLRAGGDEHVLVIAPTRAGKTVSLVIPTLLSWTESAFILDVKSELWQLTAGWRKEGSRNKVLRFEPAAAKGSCRFNPLAECETVADAQNIALLLVDPDGKGLNDHWSKTAQSLLTGCILYLCQEAKRGGPPATLPALDALLAQPAQATQPGPAILQLWTAMAAYPHDEVVRKAGQDMLDKPSPEAGSVLSTAKSYLSLYRDPTVAENVSCSDFRVADLMHHDQPVSLYVVTEATDKVRLRPLVRILANLVLRHLARGMGFEEGRPKASYKHPLLLMLDEFPTLGRLAIFEEALAYIAGYGIKAFIVTQDLSQIHNAYGKEESITGNCAIQVAFAPARLETAEHFSRMTGTTTVIKNEGPRNGSVSNTREVSRPLLTPDELLRLPGFVRDRSGKITRGGDMLVCAAGFPAVYGRQPLYFLDHDFQKRAAIPAPKRGDTIA
jgi:type IV secretion system protein VirD4